MKTQRGLIVLMTALMLSLLSLCILSPIASSNNDSLPSLSFSPMALETNAGRLAKVKIINKVGEERLVNVVSPNAPFRTEHCVSVDDPCDIKKQYEEE